MRTALPFFYHFVWYWFKVGKQFVVTALVEEDVISLANITVLCRPLSVCILFLSKKRLLPMGLGDSFTWNGFSWKFIIKASTHQELGGGQSEHCVRCGSIMEEEIS